MQRRLDQELRQIAEELDQLVNKAVNERDRAPISSARDGGTRVISFKFIW
jgi:hypothetical protein